MKEPTLREVRAIILIALAMLWLCFGILHYQHDKEMMQRFDRLEKKTDSLKIERSK